MARGERAGLLLWHCVARATTDADPQRGYTNRLTNSSALSQTARQPLSIVSE
jgi:hypothetical protein